MPLGILIVVDAGRVFFHLCEKTKQNQKLLTWALVTRKAHLREFSLISIVQETVACVLLVNRSKLTVFISTQMKLFHEQHHV